GACSRFPGWARMEVLAPPEVAPLGRVLARVPGGALFVGEGALRNRAALEAAGGELAPAHLAVPRASALLGLAELEPDQGAVPEPGSWEPLYLRGSGAERGVAG
ncbi:MAG TPA: hypothetical protein VMK65_12520, partial [Longimicrobiales bacterium]|nr:hypothetical protein [Longimicrobiales bacterium]